MGEEREGLEGSLPKAIAQEVKEQRVHDRNQDRYESQTPYDAKPVTMGALGMWLPIMFTVVGLIIAVTTSIAGVAISNTSRLSIIETLLDANQGINGDQTTELRRLNDIYERQCRPAFEAEQRAREGRQRRGLDE